MEEEALTDRRH